MRLQHAPGRLGHHLRHTRGPGFRYAPRVEASDEFYQAVADGSADPRELRLRVGLVKRRIRQSRSESVDERLFALRVARNLAASHRNEVLPLFLDDEEERVRQYALNIAVAAEADGSRVLRDGLSSRHTDVVLRALELLTRGVDRTSTGRVQRLITHGHPEVRAAAARFLGHAGGPALVTRLTRMLADPDHRVAHAAELAIERLRGDRPKRRAQDWWTAPELEDEAPPEDEDASPVQLDNFELPPPPSGGLGDPGELGSLSSLSGLGPPRTRKPSESAPGAPPAAPPASTPASRATLAKRDPIGWEPDEPAALPDPLPGEAFALAKLLSRVSVADRAAILGPLQATGEARVAIDKLTRSDEARDRCAAALAVGGLRMAPRLSTLTRLLRDAEPSVRAAAAASMAPLAGASALAQLSRLSGDADAEVRRAAVLALASAAKRLDQASFALNALGQFDGDADDGVVAALGEAKRILGS